MLQYAPNLVRDQRANGTRASGLANLQIPHNYLDTLNERAYIFDFVVLQQSIRQGHVVENVTAIPRYAKTHRHDGDQLHQDHDQQQRHRNEEGAGAGEEKGKQEEQEKGGEDIVIFLGNVTTSGPQMMGFVEENKKDVFKYLPLTFVL